MVVVDLAAVSMVGRHGSSGQDHGDRPGCLHSLALGRVRNAIEWTSAAGWDQA